MAQAQKMDRLQREMSEAMLANVSSDVEKYYFDPKLDNLNWKELVKRTKASIDEAPNAEVANAEIGALLEHLNDSHTSFIPPRTADTAEFGWKFMVIGKRAYVTEVSPGSDAAAKGMKPGDEVLTIDGFSVDRSGVSKLKEAINISCLQSLDVTLRDLQGKILHVTVAAKLDKHPLVVDLGIPPWGSNRRQNEMDEARNRSRAVYKDLGPELMIMRIPAFIEGPDEVDRLFAKVRGHNSLIIDLRGTPGGVLESVKAFLADVLVEDAKIGDTVGREGTKPVFVKCNRRGGFKGDLIVLVDSESASGAEVFARAVQLQQRGAIIGDHTSGRVMEAHIFRHVYARNVAYFYGAEVTTADFLMSDGKSLEHIGVEPDRIFLPATADIAAGTDPVLAFAAGLEGLKLTPEDAANLFQYSDHEN